MKKSQLWSADVIIGTIIVVLGITLALVIINKVILEPRIHEELVSDNEKILNIITGNTFSNIPSFIDGGSLDEDSLKAFSELDCDIIKRELGLKSDFCIFIIDEFGELQSINGVKVIGKSDAFFYVEDDFGRQFQMSCDGSLI